jgi:hypothetical protein
MVATHIGARLHSAVQSTKSFGTLANTIDAFSTTTAVIGARFHRAIGTNVWVFAYTFKVCTGTMATAVFRADHRLTSNTLPSLSADACSIVAIAVFRAGIRAQANGTVGTPPSRVTEAFVGFLCTTDTMARAIIFADHNRTVGAFPASEALATPLVAYTVASTNATVFHRARWDVTCFTRPVAVASAQASVFAFPLVRAVLRASRVRAVDTSPGRITGAVALTASTVVTAVFWARAFTAIFSGKSSVTVARSVEAFPLHGAAIQARTNRAVVGRPPVLALALAAHAVAVTTTVIGARFVYFGDSRFRRNGLIFIDFIHN